MAADATLREEEEEVRKGEAAFEAGLSPVWLITSRLFKGDLIHGMKRMFEDHIQRMKVLQIQKRSKVLISF